MPSFELEPIEGGPRVKLSGEKITIGRGPFLQVSLWCYFRQEIKFRHFYISPYNPHFYPTALKGCQGIAFTHGVRMGGRQEKLSGLYLRNRKV